MTDAAPHGRAPAWRVVRLVAPVLALALASCKAEPRNLASIEAYYRYDFTTAREALRRDAMTRDDQQTILNNVRLGMASLADGDLDEAERTLGRSFDLLSTAGLNKDKTVAAVLDHEGVRIWKGEPFEQALTYHYVALLYALKGDWENVRAAAANALFRLTDFGQDKDFQSVARRPASDDGSMPTGYTAVDTNFALGFLMQAIGSDLSGSPSAAAAQLDAAVRINKDLGPIADRLRSGDYDTLLLVDYGKGPAKVAYGPDDSLVRFDPVEDFAPALLVESAGVPLARANPVCDVNAMAQDLRWRNLEDVRRAKSAIGNVLLGGGAIATGYGANRRDSTTALAGVGAMALGLLAKAGARADTRQCEFMPQSIFLVPLRLGAERDLSVRIATRPQAAMLLNNVAPGPNGHPTVIYLRLFRDGAGGEISWLTRRRETVSNDHTGVLHGPHGYPWILGGRDVSTPDRAALEAYQANGFLRDLTTLDLQALYRDEEILLGSGAETRPDVPKNPSFRHVLDGGAGLFTPYPYSMGYKRLMFSPARPYQPHSRAARNAMAQIRVQQNTADARAPAGARSTARAHDDGLAD